MENTVINQKHPEAPMSTQDFANWGADVFAYLKPERDGKVSGYGIYAANGRHLAFAEDREIAKALVMQNELIPIDIQ